MRYVRGPFSGQKLTPHQYANDWISADNEHGRGVIVSPRSVQLDPEDRQMFTPPAPGEEAAARQFYGSFWDEWRLDNDGRFHAKHSRRRR